MAEVFIGALTIDGGEHHSGVVVGNDVCIAVLWLVDFHVGVLPGKLLARINGLRERAEQETGQGNSQKSRPQKRVMNRSHKLTKRSEVVPG